MVRPNSPGKAGMQQTHAGCTTTPVNNGAWSNQDATGMQWQQEMQASVQTYQAEDAHTATDYHYDTTAPEFCPQNQR
jgi:hypothetical protein